MGVFRSARLTLEMIKWEHSIFALPFALTGAVLAAGGVPAWSKLGWIIVCMVSARSAAMAFNRLADAQIDAVNPRTKMRHLPAGLLSRGFVIAFIVACCLVFLLGAWRLNRTTLLLAPVALAVIFFYSYTKRFTRWSHLFLGLALGIAPCAAAIAVCGYVPLAVALLGLAVLFWVAGFDILYACQDFDHDRTAGLHSVPARLGLDAAFWTARAMHVAAWLLLATVVWLAHAGTAGAIGIVLVGALLLWEHTLVSPRRLDKLNAAFFIMNGVIACVFFVATAAGVLLHRHGM